jgi:putative solute:sodium symporter small subunit|tara:strand:- start:42 stop:299 length:258 start_codon:yes stop_codon:yes gene_type:complete
MKINNSQKYWRANLGIVFLLLLFWFLSSFGAGILFSDYLDKIKIGGFNLGFWFAQQGSIIVFVFLIIIYCILMNKLDEKFNKEKS